MRPTQVLVDLAADATFANGFPHQEFERLRAEAPVAWHAPTPACPGQEGFWVISRHADCAAVLRDPSRFSSATGGHRTGGGTGLRDERNAGVMLNMTDDPKHRRLRALLARGFTPRALAQLESAITRQLEHLLSRLPSTEPFDAITALARPVPLATIAGLLGIPFSDADALMTTIDQSQATAGSQIVGQAGRSRLKEYALALIKKRRAKPAEDVFSTVVHAGHEGGGPALTDRELVAFFALLFPAGAETTRSAIGGALQAFAQAPALWDSVVPSDEALKPVVEETIRWTTPSVYKRRTVTHDCEWGSVQFRAGDKVTVWEMSANRDDRVFHNPYRFAPNRWPNPHLGFGAGVHFCLGASLARLELTTLFKVLCQQRLRFAPAGLPTLRPGNRLLGFQTLPLRQS